MPAYMVAHSHIDAAWLWRMEETIDICRESFIKVLNLLDKYNAVKYVQSSALYYKWMQKRHPDVFERIKKAVKEGRWEPTLPWVEFDANLPMGESLVRQLLYAKLYFKEVFGKEPRVVWLPDTFGYTNTLPALIAGIGAKYFLTQKLRWNDMIFFPYYYFYWEAPDGSRILAHQTIGSYGGDPDDGRIEEELRIAKLKQGIELTYIIYGYGDHGGGIDETMAEMANKLAESGKALPALPSEFFAEVEKLENLPVWRDELYLQYHRGCLVTQARFKRNHRIVERLILDAEKLATIAGWLNQEYQYPKDRLRELWEELLSLQFHDIIAGSSIKDVYEDAENVLTKLRDSITGIIGRSLQVIAEEIEVDKGELIVFNTLSWRRNAVVEIRGEDGSEKVMAVKNIPPFGYKVYTQDDDSITPVIVNEGGGEIVVSNEYFSVTISRETGAITSLMSGGREYIDSTRGGVHIQVLVDEPRWGRITLEDKYDAVLFEAWELYHLHYPEGVISTKLLKPEKVKVGRRGPILAEVTVTYRYRQEGREDSVFKITYRVYSGIPWLEILFDVDWYATRRLAKLFIPLSYSSEETLFDQPYGWISRRDPGSPDASLFDKAKWEVPGQFWAYVPAPWGGGLALLDDGKYSYDFGGNYIRLSLIRSAKYPKPYSGEDGQGFTDQGRHFFRVGLYINPVGSSILEVVKRGYEFNFTVIPWVAEKRGEGKLPPEKSFVEVDGNAIVTVLKEGVSKGYIIRLYEVDGVNTEVRLKPDIDFTYALKTTLDERVIEKLEVEDKWIKIKLNPHEIATILFL